ncbi:hypothetical protein DFH29DRAFT_359267 [Suillus ampliporus]|nr:hypothetical protein DFH29DRAFT_359267 [Suillus ampliporus]
MVKTEFLSLGEELRCFILTFLPYRDLLRATSVCKALFRTYMSSSELQYIVELGGQQLLPVTVSNAYSDNHTPMYKRLQLLKDNAHAWFRFDHSSIGTVPVPHQINHADQLTFANGHLCLWDRHTDFAMILPLLPKPSQQKIERRWSPLSHSVPDRDIINVHMDPAQSLIAILYARSDGFWSDDERFRINLGALDRDGVHPKAAGRTLFLSGLSRYADTSFGIGIMSLSGWERYIALRVYLLVDSGNSTFSLVWSLQIWDWQHSSTSNCILTDTLYTSNNQHDIDNDDDPIIPCFLGNDRLIVANEKLHLKLKLYSIEDMSQAPQLLACFSLPALVLSIKRLDSMVDITDSLRPPIQAQQTMWTSDPTNRLLSIVTGYNILFVVSTSIFFDSDSFAETIPWESWGPLNTRIFRYGRDFKVIGSRLLQVLPAVDAITDTMEYRLHMMDFSPLAVKRRQGLGRVVTEPSTIEIPKYDWQLEEIIPGAVKLTTSLPYVEVVSDRKFGEHGVKRVWVDSDRIYLCQAADPNGDDIEKVEVVETRGSLDEQT